MSSSATVSTSTLSSATQHASNVASSRTSPTTQTSTAVGATDYCETLKHNLCDPRNLLFSSRKTIKLLRQSRRRLINKNATLMNIITDLRKRDLMSTDNLDVLEQSAGGVVDLLKTLANK